MLMTSTVKKLVTYPFMAVSLMGLVNYSAIAQTHKPQVPRVLSSSTISQPTQVIDEKTALNLVWKLPQVQRKAKTIERLSKGAIRVAAAVDRHPTLEEPYYTVQVFENHVEYTDTIYWFRVLSPSGDIQVLDILQGEYVSLEKWKPN
ncbi:hypothetical protein PCC6912_30450 [Chlorogloeopsis fritschii PCC 6912]|uniref:PepSY domain-containing protein n=2 Tax=Chlorogloeopsis fritschii TaxID=1124 RepID=A0A3S0XYZ5_CHLFR|nr:hypothetical protein PCC6912_30450 [Chlorogloeopsis fritschii PCC 6912]